ncbi:Nose resistant to fluoxetine protein 6 [Frankliniella fusca]|uniref:Nose resistant to fluoxetine protein 6 n=1 Tax=Frankliniella fusca TaxID=407009 RepID=A0AAE1LB01_9NEOP|nr:Nose resistant to fluoxetine protein 6 [Frankliniella fusca]
MVQIVLAFSPLSNGAKILNCQLQDEDSLTAVHGLRFLSLAWVILVHTYLQVFAIAENKTLRTVTERNFMFQTVSNATFSVDTFFFISGVLAAFLYFRTTSRSQSPTSKVAPHSGAVPKKEHGGLRKDLIKFLILIFYRFVRLTPAYLFVLGMVELSMRWIHNNSVFEPQILDHLNCDHYWWRNALFINSLFPRKDMCMLWSWYMSTDTQFYVLGVLLLMFSARHFRLVAAALVTLMASSWVTTAFVSVQSGYLARIEEPFAKFDELYDKPWTRLGPYLIGMITGWLLFKTKGRIRMPIAVVLLGWALSLLCLVSLVYGLLHQKLGIATSAAYVSLGHTAWGAALGWIVVACYTGHGGYINQLLSFRALQPLSRLTYCAYLLHPMIQVLTSYQMDGPLHLHNALVLTLYFGNVVASFLLAFLVSLAFEAPIVRLLKIVISPRSSSGD